MVLEWLLDMIEGVLVWIAGLLPEWTDDPFSGWGQVLDHLTDLNYFLPISELFGFSLAFFTGLIPLVTVTVVFWLVALIRGGSSRG